MIYNRALVFDRNLASTEVRPSTSEDRGLVRRRLLPGRIQECEQRISGVGGIFSDVLAYARHHNSPQEVIDTLQDFENKAARLCLAGTEIALDAFIEALTHGKTSGMTGSASGATTATSVRRASSSATLGLSDKYERSVGPR